MATREELRHWRRWRKDRRDVDQRIVDRGSSPGPTAHQLDSLRRYFVNRRQLTVLMIVLVVTAAGALGMSAVYNAYSVDIQPVIHALRRAAAQEPLAALSFISTTLLTCALLYATLRYVRLTGAMVAEIAEQRRSAIEPQIVAFINEELRRAGPKAVAKWETNLVVRNIGTARAEDLRIREDWYGVEELLHHAGAEVYEKPLSLVAGEEKCSHIGVTEDDVSRWPEVASLGRPAFTLRITFRDAFLRTYSITQDYVLDRGGRLACSLRSEFRSSPTDYLYRRHGMNKQLDSVQRGVSAVIHISPDE